MSKGAMTETGTMMGNLMNLVATGRIENELGSDKHYSNSLETTFIENDKEILFDKLADSSR